MQNNIIKYKYVFNHGVKKGFKEFKSGYIKARTFSSAINKMRKIIKKQKNWSGCGMFIYLDGAWRRESSWTMREDGEILESL